MSKKLTVKFVIGSTPEGQAAEWMTQEDWDKHDAYVEECKKNGTFGKEQEATIEFQNDCFFNNNEGLILDTNTEMIEFKPLSPRFNILDYGALNIPNPKKILPKPPKQ